MTAAARNRVARNKNKNKKKAAKKTRPKANGHGCFVYVLGTNHKGRAATYVGWTNDIARRLTRHNSGTGARSTRGRVWVLLHSESFATRNEAMSREWHLKRDRAFRKQLLMERREAFASRLEP